MPINISDVVVNIGQNSQTFDFYQLVNTIISLLVTLFAAFGGAYYGAKLTDDRKIIEEKQNNIDKTLFLYSFFNKYLSQLLDYDKDFITPKIKTIRTSDLVKLNKRYPHVAFKISLKMEDFSFLMKENNILWNILYLVIAYSGTFDNCVNIFEPLIYDVDCPVDFIYIKKVEYALETLFKTYNKFRFYLLLLFKNLHILLNDYYEQKIPFSEDLKVLCEFDNAELNEEEQKWVKELEQSWNK